MAGIFSQGGSAGHRYAGWLSEVEAKNFQFGGKVFNGSPSAIYVGSNLVWAGGWLMPATVQAIVGAFGQTDGKAVIKATNAYLTQLAASDRDKATALAALINEDPMMVCSLGLQPQGVTMPIRWLVGDGNSYIDTGLVPSFQDKVEIAFSPHNYSARYVGLWGQSTAVGSADRIYSIIYTSNKQVYLTVSNQTQCNYNLTAYEAYKEIYDNGTGKILTIDGTVLKSETFTNPGATYTWHVYVFATNKSGRVEGDAANGNPLVGGVAWFKGKVGGTDIWLVPFKHKVNDTVVCCMADIESGNLFLNQGSGSFTIPDISYTPSTP